MRVNGILLVSSFCDVCIAVSRSISYTSGKQNESKISKKNLSTGNWKHSLHTGSMNASHSTNLLTNSCDHISFNGKAPSHSHINRMANARNVSFLNLSRW